MYRFRHFLPFYITLIFLSCSFNTEPTKSYELNIIINPEFSGTVSPNTPRTYVDGATASIEATAYPNFVFDHWSGDFESTENPVDFKIKEPTTITANFVYEEFPFIISVDGNGTVEKTLNKLNARSDTSYYEYNTSMQLNAVPDTGWKFEKWSGDLSGYTNPVTIKIDRAKNITAHFKKAYYINCTVEGNGVIELNPEQDYYFEGTTIMYTAIPDDGWEFSHWEGDLTGNQNPYTRNAYSDINCTAVFIPGEYVVNIDIYGEGTVTKEPDKDTYGYLEYVKLTAIPEANGWEFVEWTGDISRDNNPTTIRIYGDQNIIVKFRLFAQTGTPYLASDSLTVTLNSMDITEKIGSYVYNINYTIKNNTPDKMITEGSFKMFYANEAGGLPQYGSFSNLFPGDERTRSHSFETLKSQPFDILEYYDNFFNDEPTEGSLQWKVPIP